MKVGIVIAAIVATVAVAVGGWQLGWWLKEESVNRSAQIRRDSFEYQETRNDEIIRQAGLLADLDTQLADPSLAADQRQAITAQRQAASRQLCNIAADITGATPTVNLIITEECI